MAETVLVTGVSRGLGYGLAKCILEAGHTVYGCSRGACDLDKIYPDTFHFASIDLGDSSGGARILKDWLADIPGFDRVILNAGVLSEIRDMSETPLDSLRETMEINLWSNKWLLDEILAKPEKPRQVVAISSGAAVSGSRGWNGYSISKAALNMLVKLYAAEEPGVHFTSLAPGLIDTAMQEYICNIRDDEKFDTVQRLKTARNTPDMPGADVAGRHIAGILDQIMKGASGDFVDVRKL